MLTLVYEALNGLKSGYLKHDDYPRVTAKLSSELLYSTSEIARSLTAAQLSAWESVLPPLVT